MSHINDSRPEGNYEYDCWRYRYCFTLLPGPTGPAGPGRRPGPGGGPGAHRSPGAAGPNWSHGSHRTHRSPPEDREARPERRVPQEPQVPPGPMGERGRTGSRWTHWPGGTHGPHRTSGDSRSRRPSGHTGGGWPPGPSRRQGRGGSHRTHRPGGPGRTAGGDRANRATGRHRPCRPSRTHRPPGSCRYRRRDWPHRPHRGNRPHRALRRNWPHRPAGEAPEDIFASFIDYADMFTDGEMVTLVPSITDPTGNIGEDGSHPRNPQGRVLSGILQHFRRAERPGVYPDHAILQRQRSPGDGHIFRGQHRWLLANGSGHFILFAPADTVIFPHL